jgi:dTDP-4-dehydrorhamnose 3,5-epimerase
MQIEKTHIPGLLLLKPDVYSDERGYFMESFNRERFRTLAGIDVEFAQDNESMSAAGVVRGLHFQNPPHAQAKLVRVVQGAVLDVAVDLRTASPTFGQHYATVLSAENKLQMYIPEGFAHGFAVLENHTLFLYKCSAHYNRESEGCIRWDDPDLNINWSVPNPIVSPKDRNNATFWKEFKSTF